VGFHLVLLPVVSYLAIKVERENCSDDGTASNVNAEDLSAAKT